ncbi:non-structural maintenance of chromosomes element 1 homolog isoform X1 [Parasteatoda tepidariorum]|uniref:non-structural maintenance of chromosomes element 1 homolog isoform X1 n=1 Tax=Parasteatoda tepidariorum TaxID=114398 RepID=UPI00077FD5A0|nr:non-structural maintenance of chromosomes element 1 homolog isoform X1 [Parasteatoda tepidariorum]XP_042897877.1 non-structural maintenance of chromosomes element 1 homolog isoform X1 [Parasteatoda tepidariorum]XP_042897878.1 non-structural maintenance of chromosomes element 1 homolog isoform X1 [Parasteatoda tepidariorum]
MSSLLQDPHRMFIQIMMGKKICSAEEIRRLHRDCHEKNGTQRGDLKEFVEKINNAINPHNLAIKKGKDEISGEEYYVLINTANDELSRLNTIYKSKDLELFKRIVICVGEDANFTCLSDMDYTNTIFKMKHKIASPKILEPSTQSSKAKVIIGIVESEDGKVSSSTVLNNASAVDIRIKDANETIIRFNKDGWLLEQEGSLYFSTRAIVELEHFLMTNYGELVSRCSVCKNIVLQGVNCASCDTKIHFHCKENYFSKVAVNNTCPGCNEHFE